MANESARGLVLPVSILVSVAVGVVIGTTLARPASSSPVPRSESLPSDLNATLQALTAELERMRQQVSGLSIPSPEPTRAEVGAKEKGDLARQIELATTQLTAALNAMRTTAGSLSAERRALIAPAVPPDLPLLGKLTADDYAATIPKYQLWTYQQVMDRFGAPTSVNRLSDGGMQWMYDVSPENTVSFLFVDGRVIGMIL